LRVAAQKLFCRSGGNGELVKRKDFFQLIHLDPFYLRLSAAKLVRLSGDENGISK